MAMVEEVWKNKEDGEFYGIHSGKHFDKECVEEVKCEGVSAGFWTRPHPTPSVVALEVEVEEKE